MNKILETLEQLSSYTSQQFQEFHKLDISEIERHIRHLQNITTALSQVRDRKMATPVSKDEFFNVKEAANYMKVTTQTVYNLISANKLKTSRVGDAIRISKEDLDRYLKK